MTIVLGLVVTLGCMLGGFVVMGGHIGVIWQPAEYVIICGAATGTFIVANSAKVIKDAGKGIVEALKNAEPKQSEYLAVLGIVIRDDARAEGQAEERSRSSYRKSARNRRFSPSSLRC